MGRNIYSKTIYSASYFRYSSCYYRGKETNMMRVEESFISLSQAAFLPTHSAQRPFSSAMVYTVLARGMANGLRAEAVRQADEATLAFAPTFF